MFDELYVNIKKPFDISVDLKLGRQSLFYGTGKIIAEGTPADGSRTTYSNAVTANISPSKNHTIDLFYFNNPTTDALAINSDNRNLVEWNESGAGVHGAYSDKKDNFFNYYYIYKDEHRSATNDNNISLQYFGQF
ncbi:MAG: hypothetical protein Q9O24_11590 [Gammaproteobacteria bacterium]|nr:hypothetical protein [Gammaproteobacteria bacterium]